MSGARHPRAQFVHKTALVARPGKTALKRAASWACLFGLPLGHLCTLYRLELPTQGVWAKECSCGCFCKFGELFAVLQSVVCSSALPQPLSMRTSPCFVFRPCLFAFVPLPWVVGLWLLLCCCCLPLLPAFPRLSLSAYLACLV